MAVAISPGLQHDQRKVCFKCCIQDAAVDSAIYYIHLRGQDLTLLCAACFNLHIYYLYLCGELQKLVKIRVLGPEQSTKVFVCKLVANSFAVYVSSCIEPSLCVHWRNMPGSVNI